MPLMVMISSVVHGLADVRDAIDPVIKILRYGVIRFETVTKTPVPPRATCVEMVERSDIYLLILGEEYGDPMPGTGKAPTEEEWSVARSLGKPTVVFKKAGMNPGAAQAAFIGRVENYETGVWRRTFKDTADLISQLEGALAAAAEALQPAASTVLTSPVSVPWLGRTSGNYAMAGTVLETHVLQVGDAAPLAAATFADLRAAAAATGRDHGVFDLGQAIEFSVSDAAVVAEAKRDGRRPEAGIRVGRDRAVTVWEGLPTTASMFGAILDEVQFAKRVARDVRIAVALGVLQSELVAVAVGFADVSMLGTPNPNGGLSLPFATGGTKHAHLEPSSAWPLRALSVGADDIAHEVAAGLMLRLRANR